MTYAEMTASDTPKAEPRTPRRYDIPPWIPKDKVPGIFPAMIAANRKIEAVSKSRENAHQGYKFRGIDQVYDMVHGVLAEAGIFTAFEVLERKTTVVGKTKSGGDNVMTELRVEYWFTADDGSCCIVGPVWAEGLDTSDKGTNKCMSFAQKYVLLQTFTIPTSDVAEGDKETIERRSQEHQEQQQEQQPIGPDVASKVAQAFGALGVTVQQIEAKLGSGIALAPRTWLQQLTDWRDEITKNKSAAARIFGEPAAQSRTDALNGPPEQKAT